MPILNPLTPQLPPWLQGSLAKFWQTHVANNGKSHSGHQSELPQTIGIQDLYGSGAPAFAVALAHALLCERPLDTGAACGHCPQCKLLAAGNHTDFMQLVPEAKQTGFVPEKDKKPSKEIKIDQVRSIESQFYLSAQRGGRKVVLIYPAEQLGEVAANALLKTLEEPVGNSVFLVVSAQWSQVLPTIRSRCVTTSLPKPTDTEKIDWLQGQGVMHPQRWLDIAAGNLDKALSMAQDPLWLPLLKEMNKLTQGEYSDALEISLVFSKSEMRRVLEALVLWVSDLLAVNQGAAPVFFKPQTGALKQLSLRLLPEVCSQYLDDLNKMNNYADHPLNPRAQCEALLFGYTQLFVKH